MKIRSHWNGQYVVDKLRLLNYELLNPKMPWWTKDSIQIIELILKKGDSILEFGSGRSTNWLGKRCESIVSIEHHLKWADIVKEQLKMSPINLILVTPNITSNVWVEKQEESSIYLDYALTQGKRYNVIVIDGLFRGHCAKLATEILRPNGVIIVDNVNWYLPSDSRSPASIPINGQPISKEWEVFYEKTISWRKIFTSNGITDTAIYFA